jgi:hypothetical protein
MIYKIHFVLIHLAELRTLFNILNPEQAEVLNSTQHYSVFYTMTLRILAR